MPQTLFDKIWNQHVVSGSSGFPDTLYMDAHFINKLTSPKAFDHLRERRIPVSKPEKTFIINEPEYTSHIPLTELGRFQSDLLNRNCSDFGIDSSKATANYEGSLLGFPGQTVACDPDHTENIGALGALTIGIRETQVEQVLATQCVLLQKPKRMKIEVNGKLGRGLSVKDINHYLIAEISSEGANGYFIEFAGETITALDMDSRMAVCNMSTEIGALGGIIAPDEQTFDYLKNQGFVSDMGDYPESWKSLFSDEACVFDEVLEFDAEDIRAGTYGINISKLMCDSQKQIDLGKPLNPEGFSDTDYILSQQDAIEEYERAKNLMV